MHLISIYEWHSYVWLIGLRSSPFTNRPQVIWSSSYSEAPDSCFVLIRARWWYIFTIALRAGTRTILLDCHCVTIKLSALIRVNWIYRVKFVQMSSDNIRWETGKSSTSSAVTHALHQESTRSTPGVQWWTYTTNDFQWGQISELVNSSQHKAGDMTGSMCVRRAVRKPIS